MSVRTRGTSTRAPPPPHTSPRHATPRLVATRRDAGCGNEPSRCLNFCHALRVYERSLGSWKVFAVVDIEYERCTLRLLSVHFIPAFPSAPGAASCLLLLRLSERSDLPFIGTGEEGERLRREPKGAPFIFGIHYNKNFPAPE